MDTNHDREELIASYLDRSLPEAERREFEEHLAACDDCLSELIAAQTELRELTSKDAADAPPRPAIGPAEGHRESPFGSPLALRRSRRLASAGAAILALAAALLLTAMMQSSRFDPDYREGIHLLGRLMEVRDAGTLKLSGDGVRAAAAGTAYRGAGLLHLDLALETDKRLERALARHPGSARILNALGHFHMVDGQPEMAEIYYERALRISPDDPVLLNNLAAAAYRHGETETAQRLLLEAEHRNDPPLETIFNLGVLYGETGQRELQRVHLERYLELAPHSPWAGEARRLLEAARRRPAA
ncbi:MAG TPA: tetratricopeptide repeat protein [Candidatus Eisenbacteria bacterium]|uniref:Tetratricopeptide repeat protein n=1 Tax=Eiseniibacteriota bacterium TaxID=2212470 RepID=A0A7V2AVE0_UNCEI|nr:tetratricopeptide repeat protein [Candidatus Eisenbacteria bacterium]